MVSHELDTIWERERTTKPCNALMEVLSNHQRCGQNVRSIRLMVEREYMERTKLTRIFYILQFPNRRPLKTIGPTLVTLTSTKARHVHICTHGRCECR